MTTGTTSTPAIGPAVVDRFTLVGVRYATYLALADDLGRAGVPYRLAFDRGTLEIMSPSYRHEQGVYLISQFVFAVCLTLRLPLARGGTTTFAREDLDRGIEPDECFYLASAPQVRGRTAIDLTTDPPPDLAIEVDVSRSSVDKMAIYAALGVPEFWRYEDDALEVFALDESATFRAVEASRNLPFLSRAEIQEWLERGSSIDVTDWFLELQDWLRATVAPRLA